MGLLSKPRTAPAEATTQASAANSGPCRHTTTRQTQHEVLVQGRTVWVTRVVGTDTCGSDL